ncbi:MAG: TrmB family transcriptional regulator [Thermoproteota archaeon]|nr:TrmB family transcriptional regulator [Candidatus Brockarchaeota archaeon]MBO3767709.1 TrmB family transcriptional regulator [Candidatus Brockarchaeota archaeon]MBO3801177.1 TrmB family transcriptional regulator [Candidatus Brockarchaeota archaeon]
MSETLVNLFREYGLKEYEAKAYISLLFSGELTASELSRISEIPQPRIYDVLNSLKLKGLVEIKQERPQKFRAVEPKIALQILSNDLLAKLSNIKQTIFSEIEKLRTQDRSLLLEEPNVWIIRNLDKAKQKIKSLIESANVDIVVSSPSSLVNELKDSIVFLTRNRKNVTAAIVCYCDESKVQVNSNEAILLKQRPTPSLPIIMIDGTYCIVFAEDYSLELGEPELMRILSDFFYYSIWRPSKPLTKFKLDQEKTTSHIWLAIEIMKMSKKEDLTVKVNGFERKSRSVVEIEGSIVDYKLDPQGIFKNFTLISNEKKYLVGGLGASVEDIEARLITISKKK